MGIPLGCGYFASIACGAAILGAMSYCQIPVRQESIALLYYRLTEGVIVKVV